MKSLVLLVLLVAVAAAKLPYYGLHHGAPHGYHGYRAAYHASPYTYGAHGVYRPYGYPYSHYRGRREAEAEPEAAPEAAPEAEPEAEAGTYVYNTAPYFPHYAPLHYTVNPAAVKAKTVTTLKAPATYHYNPYYLPYGGAYAPHTYGYGFNPYHYPYVVKPVEETEADEPIAATSEEDAEAVEVSRKRREAEAEPEADPATKVVTHHVSGFPYAHLSPLSYTHHGVPTKVVKTYTHTPAYTYPTAYYGRHGYYGYPGYSGYVY